MIKKFKTCCCILLLLFVCFLTSQSSTQNKSQADIPIAHTKVCECNWKRANTLSYFHWAALMKNHKQRCLWILRQSNTLYLLEKEKHMLQRMKKWFSFFFRGAYFPQALSRSESRFGQRPHPGDSGWYRQDKTLSENRHFTSFKGINSSTAWWLGTYLFWEPEAEDCREKHLQPQHAQLQQLYLLKSICFNIVFDKNIHIFRDLFVLPS